MRILSFLRNSYQRFFTHNLFIQQQHNSTNWRNKSIYLTCILSGLYAAGNTSINFHWKLSNAVMAQTDQVENGINKTRKTTTLNFLADAVEVAAPSVVHVDVLSKQRRFYQEANSSGSGFIVTEAGIVLTNAHVVGNANKVNVRLSSGETYTGWVIDVDNETDLAAVKLDNKSNVCLCNVCL